MNKNYNLLGSNGYWFVKGQGFTARTQKDASVVGNDDITCLTNLGFVFTAKAPLVVSFAVCYVRKDDLNANGTVRPNAKNPSRRRFATRDEAHQHGSRFAERKAQGSNVPGSAGHVGFYVIETNDPVNATINWKTGLTNPLA